MTELFGKDEEFVLKEIPDGIFTVENEVETSDSVPEKMNDASDWASSIVAK